MRVLPLLILPPLAFAVRPWLPAWAFMWAIAGAIYAGCKWLTYYEARRFNAGGLHAIGYLIAWPGMDGSTFLRERRGVDSPARLEWCLAAVKTCFGATLTWLIAPIALNDHPLAAGWMAMIGLVFMLHFGTFHLMSLGWRSAGVDAEPIMRNPLAASSVGDFWGRRWNTAFHDLATRFTFQPLRRFTGPLAATLAAFVMSGLIHELVITVPAGGGYGLPTAYFVVQGLAVAGERTRPGRRLGLGCGWRGRLFTALVTAGPAFWLFPPPFVYNVVLPMLRAIGAS